MDEPTDENATVGAVTGLRCMYTSVVVCQALNRKMNADETTASALKEIASICRFSILPKGLKQVVAKYSPDLVEIVEEAPQ